MIHEWNTNIDKEKLEILDLKTSLDGFKNRVKKAE
jgi:hypothetical protein